jgi:hypothetical protein
MSIRGSSVAAQLPSVPARRTSHRVKWTQFLKFGWPDALRMLRHGSNAPRIAERIWIRPADCDAAISSVSRQQTGQVLDGDWDLHTRPLSDLPKVQMALLHWQAGRSWRDVGAYDYMMERIAERGELDGCRSLEDVIARYERLDVMFERVKTEKRLRPLSEVRPDNFRERGGVYIHIGRHNNPIFGGGGCHRLAMAIILGIDEIPAQVGVVHPRALAQWRSFRLPQSDRRTDTTQQHSTSSS